MAGHAAIDVRIPRTILRRVMLYLFALQASWCSVVRIAAELVVLVPSLSWNIVVDRSVKPEVWQSF